jgi:hypothetical protein
VAVEAGFVEEFDYACHTIDCRLLFGRVQGESNTWKERKKSLHSFIEIGGKKKY